MKVAVVGGSGFVGRHVVRRLLAAGARVVTIDRRAPADPQPGEEYVGGEIGADLKPEALAAICGRTEAVVWLAAVIRQRRGVDEAAPEDLRIMVEAPLRFLAAVEPPPASFIYLSSVQVYGAPLCLPVDEDHPTEPFTAYGVAKLCAEQYLGIACRARRTALASLRVAFVYGPGQHSHNVIPKFLDALRRRERRRCTVRERTCGTTSTSTMSPERSSWPSSADAERGVQRGLGPTAYHSSGGRGGLPYLGHGPPAAPGPRAQ